MNVIVAMENCAVLTSSWTKTGLRVRDGAGDRRSGASRACISPTAASAVARRPRGGDEQA
jgi:hypothetical protein